MTLPINTEDYDYRFLKTLNHDVKLTSNEYGEWDIVFNSIDNDWVDVTGRESLVNACIIAIMTRYTELDIEIYEDFGCRVHELIKANKSKNLLYKLEIFITETLNKIRRVKKVYWVIVEDMVDENYYNYQVRFKVSCIRDDDDYNDDDELLIFIEDMFYI